MSSRRKLFGFGSAVVGIVTAYSLGVHFLLGPSDNLEDRPEKRNVPESSPALVVDNPPPAPVLDIRNPGPDGFEFVWQDKGKWAVVPKKSPTFEDSLEIKKVELHPEHPGKSVEMTILAEVPPTHPIEKMLLYEKPPQGSEFVPVGENTFAFLGVGRFDLQEREKGTYTYRLAMQSKGQQYSFPKEVTVTYSGEHVDLPPIIESFLPYKQSFSYSAVDYGEERGLEKIILLKDNKIVYSEDILGKARLFGEDIPLDKWFNAEETAEYTLQVIDKTRHMAESTITLAPALK
ncbi:MAG TPA: hypothetical protein VJJ75_02290 [Candidatus Nanoarchaeia archaeon]|nr:hypothetical protein [Candidatus Nanoarchaeia archaeon]